ncbi:MAG: helix-turn-helix domain containing protein [Donghicola eburneus]|nr:helix-turn-helix domain-containing protein [Donghicola eburneus]MCI5041004.1 helix-turn-helix domain containing protein [Donghicola eburneus]
MSEVEETIAHLKQRYRVSSDVQLAKVLGVSKSTISSWRARNKVPERVLEVIESDMVATQSPPVEWGPFQKLAFGLALQRYCRVLADHMESSDFKYAMKLAGTPEAFFALMGQAEGAILNMQESGDFNYETAVAALVHEDIINPEKAGARDLETLREYGLFKV